MGGSSSYLKMRANDHVASFIYQRNTSQYIQQTFSCHPDNQFKTKKYQNYNYYYYYSGGYYYFDGDWDRLHEILDNYDPKITPVTYLVARLEVECDLQKYKPFWEKVNEWKNFVVSIPTRALEYVVSIPTSTLEYVWWSAKKMIGYENVEVKQITNY